MEKNYQTEPETDVGYEECNALALTVSSRMEKLNRLLDLLESSDTKEIVKEAIKASYSE